MRQPHPPECRAERWLPHQALPAEKAAATLPPKRAACCRRCCRAWLAWLALLQQVEQRCVLALALRLRCGAPPLEPAWLVWAPCHQCGSVGCSSGIAR